MKGTMALWALLAAVAGCGPSTPKERPEDADGDADADGDSDTDADPSLVPFSEQPAALAELCGSLTEALCRGFEACCATGWSEDVRARCTGALQQNCVDQYTFLLRTPGVRLARAGWDGCVQDVDDWLAVCPDGWTQAPSCDVLRGTLPEGSRCSAERACGDGLACLDTCTRFEEGEACESSCGNALRCFDGSCVRPRALGEACTSLPGTDGSTDDCADDTWCGPDGVCAALRAPGEPCAEHRECPGMCVERCIDDTPLQACDPIPDWL